ncbi:MAG: AsmA family protein [Bryobacteraceae bacterium]
MKTGRVLLLGVGLILMAGVVAPYLHADSFRRRIEVALDRALGRKIKIGDVRFNLFTGPGFTLSDVTIPEDPGIGIEPMAYVTSLEARIRLLSLLRGRLEFSNLRLVGGQTTVNLTKSAAGPWNFQILLNRMAQASAGSMLPAIEVRSGRLNFKFGDTKSVFYIDGADLDVEPLDGGRIYVRFSGEPARTDRTGQSFGELSGSGTLRRVRGAESQLDMELDLERSPLTEVVKLFEDRGIGLHGNIVCTSHISGPVSNLQVTGQLLIADIHRWDLMPAAGGGWQLNYRGTLRPITQQFELGTVGTAAGVRPPVGLRFRIADYLTRPRWAASVELHQLPAATLLEVARHLGVAMPEQLSLAGNVDGVVGYGQPGGFQGQVTLQDAVLQAPGAAPIRSSRAELLIAGDAIELAPGTIEMNGGQSVDAEGHFTLSTRDVELKFTTKGLKVADLQSGPGRLLGPVPIPLLDNCRQGEWKGWVAYRASSDTVGAWSGKFDLENARLDAPGIGETLHLTSAAVTVDGPETTISRLRGAAGRIKFEGSYRLEPGTARPDKLRLKIAEAGLRQIETLVLPALRRQQGFLARTLRFGRNNPAPEWLTGRRVDADIQIADLTVGDAHWSPVRCRLLWDGAVARLAAIEARQDDTALTGELTADLSNANGPRYKFAGRLQNAIYKDGRLDVEGHMETAGVGAELMVNARGAGEFHARGVAFSPDADFHDFSGCFGFSLANGSPRVRLTSVEAEQGTDAYVGEGATQPDGRLVLDLASGAKQVELAGSLFP